MQVRTEYLVGGGEIRPFYYLVTGIKGQWVTGIKGHRHRHWVNDKFYLSICSNVPMFQPKTSIHRIFQDSESQETWFRSATKKPVSISYLKQCGTLEQHTKYTALYIYNINIYSSSSKGLKEFAPIVIHKLIHRFCVALHMEHVGTWNRLWNRPESY